MQYFYGLLWLLFVHWIADFVLQSDWMAQNKSKSIEALSTHVLAYITILLVAGTPLVFVLPQFPRIGDWFLIWVGINGAAHFATDYVTSRISARLHANHRHYFYVMIGFDQLIHYFTLALTMVWLLKPVTV